MESNHLSTSYSSFVDLKIHGGPTLCGLFDSPCAGMGLHVKEGVKGKMFILNPNPTTLSF